MTDNEIIKAYEQCIIHRTCSKKCAYFNTKSCKDTMVRNVNDLIIRQKAEIERARSTLSYQKDLVERMYQGHEAFVKNAMCSNLVIDNLVKEMTDRKEDEGK